MPRLPISIDLLPGVSDPLGDITIGSGGKWAESLCNKIDHVKALQTIIDSIYTPPASLRGDGVVIVGGGKYWPMAAVAVRMTRKATRLPIQVWYGGESDSVDPSLIDGIGGVTFHDVTNYSPRKIAGWENKTTAILNSGLRRVIYLDADAYLVSDPTPLLDIASESRFVFWGDFPNQATTVKWDWYGLKPNKIEPVQGGQLAIDINAFWRELVIAHWINMHSDYFFPTHTPSDHQYGDQDSWRVALAATKGTYKYLGRAGWSEKAFVCSLDTPIAIHRVQCKLLPNKTPPFHDWLPYEGDYRKAVERTFTKNGPAGDVFGRIYQGGLWGPPGDSGGGSSDEQSLPYLETLGSLAKLAKWRSCVDLGCGDGRVTKQLPFPRVKGVDCHAPHVERLSLEFPSVEWTHADIDWDRESLPHADVALVRDVLHHWPNDLVRDWIEWATGCGKWEYVVFCHDRVQLVDDCELGGYRGLDIDREPLVGLGLSPVANYMHKGIYLLECK